MKNKVDLLKEIIEKRLPGIKKLAHSKVNKVILHQDAFAADYQDDEYFLFGMTIKYLGLFKKEILIIGKNRETLK